MTTRPVDTGAMRRLIDIEEESRDNRRRGTQQRDIELNKLRQTSQRDQVAGPRHPSWPTVSMRPLAITKRTVPLWPSATTSKSRQCQRGHRQSTTTDSVNLTIGRILNYRSGSAKVATTGTGSQQTPRADSAMPLWPSVMTTNGLTEST
jgi:hypothetical protein